jgi:glycosyltransferase involved in cell wall biosynthesis
MDPWATIADRLGVLQLLPDLAPNGPARVAVDIAAGVAAAGGRAVVVSGGGRLTADLLRCGATHIEMPLSADKALSRWSNARRRLAKLVGEHQISIIHTHDPATAAIAKKLAEETRSLYTMTCHELYGEQVLAELRRGAVLEGAQRVIAVSKTAAAHLHSSLPGLRALVVTPGVDLPRFDPARVSAERIIRLAQAWRLPDGRPVIMLPGPLAPSPAHGELIEALELMQGLDFHCIFAAETPADAGYERELAALARRHGIEGRLVIGEDCRDMPAAYMLADVVVHARADATGFAPVVAEAHAMGRPLVAYDSALLREQAGESRMTWLVPPGDRRALAQAIGEALALSAGERQALAPELGAQVRQRYNHATSAAAMIEVFLDLLIGAEAA